MSGRWFAVRCSTIIFCMTGIFRIKATGCTGSRMTAPADDAAVITVTGSLPEGGYITAWPVNVTIDDMKKLSAVLIVLVLTFSLSTVAFATPVTVTESTTGTINITAQNAGDTFAAYRIVDVTYTAASNSLSYAFDSSVADFFTGKSMNVAQYSTLSNSTSPTLESVQGELAAWIKANSVTTTYTDTAGSEKTCSISSLPLGQYLVLGTGNATSGAYVYQIMTANEKS